MQKSVFLFGLLLCGVLQLSAQALDLGCNGTRYKQDVFTNIKVTTVNYAPTISHTGLAMTLQMDVYEPEGDNATARPAIVLAHGGSFIFGDRTMMATWCQRLARKGYVTATIQYRLYPLLVFGFPDSVDIFDSAVKAVGDMKAAVRYLREDAATTNLFHVDPENIFIGGYSAGAVTALHAGYLDENDAIPAFMQTLIAANGGLEGSSGTASNQTYASSAKAVANMSGGIYRREWLDNQTLPMVSIHGTADETVPYLSGIAAGIAYLEGSGLLHPEAEAAGIWSYLETVPGGGHSDIYDQPQFAVSLNSFITHATDLLESLVCASSGANDIQAGHDGWTLGPNPGKGAFAVYLPEGLAAADVRVFDATGKLFFQQKNVVSGGAVTAGNWPAGNYFVQIADPGNPGKAFPLRQLVRQ